ncbi:hypothetical protein [Hydrogenophaga atypica]|uniref:ArsR family transcriptional regulator n=1 Tax=Hydrogenophaga atypica TaxID=249409 RepID=A0ABW2QQ82_9BURK
MNEVQEQSSQVLFVHLMHVLKKYTDVCVLMALLSDQADLKEVKTTAGEIALHKMHMKVPRLAVQRSFDRLSDLGLIDIRVHANTRTHVTVNRDAVLAFLRQPLPSRLPGLSAREFPFLEAWAADRAMAESLSPADESSAQVLQ